MKFLDFKKYFFSYFYIIFAFVGIYLLWLSSTFPPPTEDEFLSDGSGYFMLGGLSIFAYWWCCGFLLLEILLRRFVIPKIFPKLNITFKIDIPKKLNIVLSALFYIFFAIATVPLIITVIALIWSIFD